MKINMSTLVLLAAILAIGYSLTIAQSPRSDNGRGSKTRQSGMTWTVSPTGSSSVSGDGRFLYDVKYYGLEFDLSTATSAFGGNATMKGLVGATPIDTLVLALINTANGATMTTDSVFVEGTRRAFVHKNNLIQISMIPPLSPSSSFTSRVYYHGNDGNSGVGLVRATKYGVTFLHTNTGSLYPSYLFPCKDMMEDWADSVNIAITTEPSNKIVATGGLVRTTPTGDGRLRWEFSSRWGLITGDIAFAVGPYFEYRTSFYLSAIADSMVIRGFLLPASPNLSKQIVAIEKSKEYLKYFTDLFGAIPFWRYEHHFVINEWNSPCMSAFGFSQFSDIRLDTAVVDRGGYLVYYVPHELSHDWFESTVGGLTECDQWFMEGFATYAEQLAMEHFQTVSVGRLNMRLSRELVMSLPGGSVYIPPADRYNESRVFDNRLTYVKGAAIVHTLRFELGSDSLFFRVMRDYLAEFSGCAVTAEIFKDFLKRRTGIDFSAFFAQWYYGEGYPTFAIRWVREPGGVRIVSTQTPSMPLITPFFQTPLEIRLKYTGGVERYDHPCISGQSDRSVSNPDFKGCRLDHHGSERMVDL